MNLLRSNLIKHLDTIGLPTDFTLDLRGYSKSYKGRYYPINSVLAVYVLNENNDEICYSEILDVVIHEAIHHYQWKHDSNFKRVRGVMHNTEFWKLYNKCKSKVVKLGLLN